MIHSATIYDDRYSAAACNVWAREIFESSFDSVQLSDALSWARKAMNQDTLHGNAVDTYANLVYKLGRKSEANPRQEKAVALKPEK